MKDIVLKGKKIYLNINKKQKIRKKKLKDEDEIFQKKIREIKLQQQFNQLGRDAVEFKQFQNIEEGMEKKVNNKQNQSLVEKLAEERINWEKINMRYNKAKNDNKYCSDLLGNYNDRYLMSAALNDMINEEDKKYKKAVYDRERALHKYLQEDIKEKNKFSNNYNLDSTAKKKKRVSKSVVIDKNKNNMNNVPNMEDIKKEEKQDKIEEGNEEEDENDIQNKLNNENKMEEKQLVSS